MKRFSRCALILIIITLLGAIGGYVFETTTTTSVYSSTAKVIVTPGEQNEASVRATDGGLVKDFEVVFASSTVITAAQKSAGTSEDIGSYLTVKTVPNSNIVELTVANPDQSTAKAYVDAVAKNVSKTTSILSVESIQVLEYGTESNVAYKPDVMRNTGIIAAIVAALCLIIELIIVFVLNAFKDEDNSDDEGDYERRFGNMIAANYMLAYNQNGYPKTGIAQDDSNEDDSLEDEDDKFNRAIGADVYKEELSKIFEDEDKNKKKQSKKDKKKKADNVVAFDAGQAARSSVDEEEEPDVDFDDTDSASESTAAVQDDYDDNVDFDKDDAADTVSENPQGDTAAADAESAVEAARAVSAASNVASIADYEAAAAKEQDSDDQKDKTSKRGKKEMRSSSEVLGTIRK